MFLREQVRRSTLYILQRNETEMLYVATLTIYSPSFMSLHARGGGGGGGGRGGGGAGRKVYFFSLNSTTSAIPLVLSSRSVQTVFSFHSLRDVSINYDV